MLTTLTLPSDAGSDGCGNNQSAIRNPRSARVTALPSPWRTLLRFAELDSTQLEANRRLEAGEAMAGVILWAEHQAAGRGRMNHDWISQPGGLYVTAGFPEGWPLTLPDTGWISLIAALAAVAILRRDFAIEAWVKWPNDILVQGRKVGGLLGEAKALDGSKRLFLVGLGLNWLNRVVLAEAAGASAPPGSLFEFRPELTLADRERFLHGWMDQLNGWHVRLVRDYDGSLESLREAVEAVLWRNGEEVLLKHTERGPVAGRLLGLGAGGAARLAEGAGQVNEVHCGWQAEKAAG